VGAVFLPAARAARGRHLVPRTRRLGFLVESRGARSRYSSISSTAGGGGWRDLYGRLEPAPQAAPRAAVVILDHGAGASQRRFAALEADRTSPRPRAKFWSSSGTIRLKTTFLRTACPLELGHWKPLAVARELHELGVKRAGQLAWAPGWRRGPVTIWARTAPGRRPGAWL